MKLSGTIHDLQPIELGAFSEDKARDYLIGRGEYHEFHLDQETIAAILFAVEWLIPFHLNLVFEELRAIAAEKKTPPSPALVEIAVQTLMRKGRTHFDHWDERLEKIMDTRLPRYCELMLGVTCHEKNGVKVETLELRLRQEISDDQERAVVMRQVLDLLISDAYLVRSMDVVRFRSALVRRYWLEVQG